MANVDDPRDDTRQYRRAREKVRETADPRDREGWDLTSEPVPEIDREAILAFGEVKDDASARTTATGQMRYARICAEIAADVDAPPLTEWGQAEFERFYARLKNSEVPDFYVRHVSGETWGDGSLRNFKNALKQLLLYLGDRADGARPWTDADARDWVEDVTLGAPPQPDVRAEDLLGPAELAAMWAAIDSLRDRAMFAVLYCTWQRNATVRSFRVGDVEFHDGGAVATVSINEDASGRKGATGAKPLSWAAGPVKEFLDSHPRGDDPGAALLCVTHDSGDAQLGAPLSSSNAINRRLRTIAKRAGLEKDRWDTSTGRKQRTARAHLLRYTGATRAAKSDEYAEATVKRWAGWVQSSDQLDRYIQQADDDVLASWASTHEIETDAFDAQQPEFGSCGRCNGPVENWLRSCPSCGHEIGAEAPGRTEVDVREVVREEIQRLFEDAESTNLAEFKLKKAIADSELADERSSFGIEFE